MSEKKIQAAVEKLVAAGTLVHAIEGRERPAQMLAALRSASWLPSFPIDYLIRKRAAEAADRVLAIIGNLTTVSTAKKSISLTTGETLFPDLLGGNRELAALAIFELKANEQTERQAVTELLAYDHEVRNHLPFISNSDLGLVVISPDFSPLLDHSIASLITWQRRSILCLRAVLDGDNLRLSVHLPSCWSPLGQAALPPGALRVGRLVFGPKRGYSVEDARGAAFTALQLIRRRGERTGSHGFVMLCQDEYYPNASEVPLWFLVGLLDPYVFLQAAADLVPGLKLETPLADFLLRGSHLADNSVTPAPFEAVCTPAAQHLDKWCEFDWDIFTSWDRERAPVARFVGAFEFPRRVTALHIDAWGDVGEYLEEMSLHPAILQHFMPHFDRPGFDWTTPPFAVALLDWMTTESIFLHGQITCEGVFHLGMRLGRSLCAYRTCEGVKDGDYKTLPNFLVWCNNDLMDAFREVTYRVHSTDDVKAPEGMALAGPTHAREAVRSIERRIDWLLSEFITGKYPAHQELLRLGLNAHLFFDDYFAAGVSREQWQEITQGMIAASRRYLELCLGYVLEPGADEGKRGRLVERFRTGYGIEITPDMTLEAGKGLLGQVPDQRHIDRFVDTLLPMLDTFMPLVFHRLRPIRHETIDWDWLRDQIRHLRAGGAKRPGLILWPSGEIATSIFDRVRAPLPQVNDLEREVLVCRNEGVEHFSVYTWEELAGGRLSREVGG